MNNETGRLLTPSPNPQGYLFVDLFGHTKAVHRIVLKTFVGPPPPKHDACHKNGNRGDNRLSNLRWDTRANNMKDIPQETRARLAALTSARFLSLTRDQAEEVIKRLDYGESQWSVARSFGITQATISNIKLGVRWKEVERPPGFYESWKGVSSRKLTDSEIADAFRRVGDGEAIASVARAVGLSDISFRRACRGQTYRNIKRPESLVALIESRRGSRRKRG